MRIERWRGPATTVGWILLVTAAYYAGGRIGLLRRIVVDGAHVTPLWLPTGIALAALLRLGPRIWPGIVLGTYLVITSISPFDHTSVAILIGNTLAPLCAWALLRRAGFRTELDRLRDGLALVFLGGLLPMLISSTTGTVVLLATGSVPESGAWTVWSAWWAGDAMGVLVLTPVLLCVRRPELPVELLRALEAAVMLAATALVTLAAVHSDLSLLFLVFPVIIWAAVRFQLPGAAPCVLIVSVVAIGAATERDGPFAGHTWFEVMVNLQALNGAAALTGLLLSALVTEQNNIRLKVEEACEELEEVIAQLRSGRPR
ncbi:MASE1 domain-containing protein [Streptomyces antimicrobicus]|uniref:MASE1 domain-containing protein n=1 Tax=Streptomyces antimicrobicus TaxID=2883108 RepID=A0ABS8B681_9ACTN|nr:MASE1 domain-containing protein [Streptomyces antimicrobicus]MCB5180115.1 MASE1 domain-containing protein [Streptomyces antimicrobicus]